MQAEDKSRRAVTLDRVARYLAVIAILVMCASFSTGYYVATRPTAVPTPTETVLPTGTREPTPTKTAPPSARAVGAPPRFANVPGLTPGEAVETFMSYMFTCLDPTQTEAGLYTWECRQESSYAVSQVRILSRTQETVDQVTAAIQIEGRSRDEEIGRFLSEAARLPYTGAEPDQAADWVRLQVPGLDAEDEPLTAVFGDVLFELSAVEDVYTLVMGELPEGD